MCVCRGISGGGGSGEGGPSLRALTEHVARQRERARQVFCRLRLARAGRPRGRAAQHEPQRQRERDVAPVRQRRDDEAARVADPLVAVPAAEVSDGDVNVARLRHPVEPELLRPDEAARAVRLHVDQLLDDVPAVHVERDERDDLCAEVGRQVAEHALDQLAQALVAHRQVLFHRVLLPALQLVQRGLRLLGPVDLRAREHNLRGVVLEPQVARLLHLPVDGRLDARLEDAAHAVLLHDGEVVEPALDGARHHERLVELDDLAVLGEHLVGDVLDRAHGAVEAAFELEVADRVEAVCAR